MPSGTDAPNMARMNLPDDPQALQALLTDLKIEHHDLDESIGKLEDSPPHDELLMRRMKKRKLQLKDRISAVERLLGPDLTA